MVTVVSKLEQAPEKALSSKVLGHPSPPIQHGGQKHRATVWGTSITGTTSSATSQEGTE